jgi:hypothetical protein
MDWLEERLIAITRSKALGNKKIFDVLSEIFFPSFKFFYFLVKK